jgi:hypothetical protein
MIGWNINWKLNKNFNNIKIHNKMIYKVIIVKKILNFLFKIVNKRRKGKEELKIILVEEID